MQIKIHRLVFIDVKLDAGADCLLESRRSGADGVEAGRQAGRVVEAVFSRGDCTRRAGLLLRDRDFRFGHRGALRVTNRAGDVSCGARLAVHADKETYTQQE